MILAILPLAIFGLANCSITIDGEVDKEVLEQKE